ncbi:lipase ZK262.3-like [Mya arenaria]|uniref:lipase ZK262.3-like n=1 Tax=Mya arenaria TaxID=6604 RepID=UPI0022DF01CF|nr:lipase ZK262.3-like [Mya arenaria]
MIRALVFLLLFFHVIRCSPDCDSEMDCVSCTRTESWDGDPCRWCPLDNACHAFGSLVNSCRKDQNIILPNNCYQKTYGVYNVSRAFANTLLSAVAYSDDPQKCIDAIYREGGFRLVKAVAMRCDDIPFFDYKECYAFMTVSEKEKIISMSFRGTNQGQQLLDEFLSVLIIPKVNYIGGGKVEEFFLNAYNKLYPCAKQSVLELLESYPDYEVVISGHSLGGAIASITATSLVYENIVRAQKLSLYTFGMPRVGDKEFALRHDILLNNSWRVVHHRDPVVHLPTCSLGYGCKIPDGPFHAKTEVYYPSDYMGVNSYYRVCENNEDDYCSDGDDIIT